MPRYLKVLAARSIGLLASLSGAAQLPKSDVHDVNLLLMQPFVNYNFGKGWYAVTAPILTADWTAAKGDQ
jgi:hypothetical protein